MIYEDAFGEFTISNDTLWVYEGDTLIFSSREEGLAPLLKYIRLFVPRVRDVIAFDRVVGNAGALLLKAALCSEAFAPLGSELAARTLERYGIRFHFTSTVPRILDRYGNDMCPMEKLSLGMGPRKFLKRLTPP